MFSGGSIKNRYLNLLRILENFTQIIIYSEASYIKIIVFISVNEVVSIKKKSLNFILLLIDPVLEITFSPE